MNLQVRNEFHHFVKRLATLMNPTDETLTPGAHREALPRLGSSFSKASAGQKWGFLYDYRGLGIAKIRRLARVPDLLKLEVMSRLQSQKIELSHRGQIALAAVLAS